MLMLSKIFENLKSALKGHWYNRKKK